MNSLNDTKLHFVTKFVLDLCFLQWFGHIQRRPPEAAVHIGRIKRADNVKRGRGRPNLTWDESVKRDLKD